eukprot:gene5248-biopygen1939
MFCIFLLSPRGATSSNIQSTRSNVQQHPVHEEQRPATSSPRGATSSNIQSTRSNVQQAGGGEAGPAPRRSPVRDVESLVASVGTLPHLRSERAEVLAGVNRVRLLDLARAAAVRRVAVLLQCDGGEGRLLQRPRRADVRPVLACQH